MPKSPKHPKLESRYDVVVVGAGNGGLGAALELAVKGVRPLLLEQHNLPGGFATSFVRGRFEFEASLHELADIGSEAKKGGTRRFLEDEAGVDIEWVAVPDAYRVILTDSGLDVRMPFGIDEYGAALEREAPGSREPFDKYISLCKDVIDVLGFLAKMGGKPDLKKLAAEVSVLFKSSDKPFDELKDSFIKLSNFLKTVPATVEEVTGTFGFDPKALDIMFPYWCYLGVPMSRMSFISWGTMLYSYLTCGAYVPKCRSHEMTAAMDARIRELGGAVEYNTRVERILVKNGRVTGVETSNGDCISTEHIISNASPTLVYNKLIEPRSEVPAAAYRNVNARKHAATAFVVYLGLDASPQKLGLDDYGYFISNNMNTEEIYDSMGKLGPVAMQATICLNNAVPDCSPPGTTMLSMTTMYQADVWQGVKPADYLALKNSIADTMITQFEQGTGIKIRKHIEELEVATPATFARYTRTYGGVIYGYELDPWDAIIPRVLSMKDESYIKGLEFAGGWAFMGHGYNVSMLSGRQAALATLAKMGVK